MRNCCNGYMTQAFNTMVTMKELVGKHILFLSVGAQWVIVV